MLRVLEQQLIKTYGFFIFIPSKTQDFKHQIHSIS